MIIDAYRLNYRVLSDKIRSILKGGERQIVLNNINGQRYIGCGLNQQAELVVNGVAGNDLGGFMDGPSIIVHGNAQDVIANTMSSGKVIVHGDVGDVAGYSMRGGKLFVRGNAGYRVGINMKSCGNKFPTIIIGGTAGDFFGEYMAGGVLVLLDLDGRTPPIAGNYLGTGMHGGTIYIRGQVKEWQLGKEVTSVKLGTEDQSQLERILAEYCEDFRIDLERVVGERFVKLIPNSHRPYGEIYAY